MSALDSAVEVGIGLAERAYPDTSLESWMSILDGQRCEWISRGTSRWSDLWE